MKIPLSLRVSRNSAERYLAEFTGQRLSAVTLFMKLQEKPMDYKLSSIKDIVTDDCFSDMRMNIYEVANLKFIYR